MAQQEFTSTSGTHLDVRNTINSNAVDAENRITSLETGGVSGDSAYEVAVSEGFVGDETAWLASLVGADGAAGADGATGAAGADGLDGKTVLNGIVVPTAEGVDGDFYIKTDTSEIYGPKTGGAWGPATSLIGADGAAGADGTSITLKGSVADFASLPAGASAGDLYVTLDTGDGWVSDGAEGWSNVGAIQGPAGADGAIGPEGPEGPDGPAGPAGADGTGIAIVGSVADETLLDPSYGGSIGDMFIAQNTGFGFVWSGSVWDNVGQIQGPEGPAGTANNEAYSISWSGDTSSAATRSALYNKIETLNAGTTNLTSGNRTSTTLQIIPDVGTPATVLSANAGLAGLMSSADKNKLDGISNTLSADLISLGFAVDNNSNKETNVSTNLGYTASEFDGIITSSDGTDATIPIVTFTEAGLLAPYMLQTFAYITVTAPVDLDGIKTRVDDLDQAVVLRGNWDASAGTFAGGGTAQAGDSYIVSVGGTVDGVEFIENDRIIAISDNASVNTFNSNWYKTSSAAGADGADGTSVVLKGSVADFASLPAGASAGDLYVTLDTGDGYVSDGAEGWSNVGAIQGPAGADGADGAAGLDGKTVLNGIVVPTAEGVDGDFYIKTDTSDLYGPKTGGAWGPATSLIGADGADGADGAAGLDGKTVLNGIVVPTTEGVDGDFYIKTDTSDLYGPKTGGAWGPATSLIGADGAAGADGATGADGAAGQGVPTGGTTGQALVKVDDTDYNTQWATSGAGDVLKVGAPANNQIGVWTGDGTIEGTSNFTYDGNILDVKNGGVASSMRLYCEVANAHYTELKSAPHANYSGNVSFVLPSADGSSGNVLQTDGAGNLSFIAPAGGVAKTGFPADNYLAIWTDANTVTGQPTLKFSNRTLNIGDFSGGILTLGLDKKIVEYNGGTPILSNIYSLDFFTRTTIQNALLELPNVDPVSISYNNTNSGLSATNVKAAIDEVAGSGSSADDTAYGVSWNGDTTTAASKNAIYDKIESIESVSKTWLITKMGNEDDDISGTGEKVAWVAPAAGKIYAVESSVSTVCDENITVDLKINGASVLSTQGRIPANVEDSTTAIASLWHVLSANPTSFAKGDRISFEVSVLSGTPVGGKGLHTDLQISWD